MAADMIVSNLGWSEAFEFDPNDEHMIEFLKDRLLGLPAPGIQGLSFKDVNVYGDLTPQEIFAKSEFRGPNETDTERYCFTQLKRTTPGGKRFVRTTGGGTWKLQHDHHIERGVSLRRSFSYKRKSDPTAEPQPPDDHDWVMYEYTLQGYDLALCQIKKNSSRKRYRSGEDGEGMRRKGSSKSSRTNETSNIEACSALPLQAVKPNVDNGFLMCPYPKLEDNDPTLLEDDFKAHFATEEMFDISELLND